MGAAGADMDRESGAILLGKPLGGQRHYRAMRVEKPGVVRIAVNDGVTPEGARDVRPEDHSHSAASGQDVPSLVVIAGAAEKVRW